MKRKSILVTGGSGFIGANLVRALIREKHDVHIVTRTTSNLWRLHEVQRVIRIHKTDYTDSDGIRRIVSKIKPTLIYHLAAFGNYHTQRDLYTMIHSNILFTAYLLTALQTTAYELFVYLGSSSEYGFKTTPMKESDVLEPNSFYAATKACATYISQVYAKLYKKPIVVVRPFSVYGPFEETTRLIPTVILSCLKNRAILATNGDEMRDFIYVGDLVDSLLMIHKLKKLPGEIINIGSGKQYSTREIVTTIHALLKSKSIIKWGTYPSHYWDTSFWQADTTVARKKLGWTARYALKKGLTETIEWFKKHNYNYEK